jgi:TP901 family phage tail tape measure protein
MRKEMSDAARAVATSTTFAASEAADAFFFLASAGLSAEQSIAALPKVAAFAQAGQFDLAKATDLLTDAQTALGLSSDDAAENFANLSRVSDVLVKANTMANASVEEFSQALTEKAATAMAQLGMEVEEGIALLAVFAERGVKGSAAGTLLNSTLEGLTRTASTNADEYAKLGLSVFDAQGEMRNMADIVGDMEKAFDGMSTQQRNAEIRNLGFTRTAQDGIRALLGNADAIREFEAAAREAGGTTEEIAEKQLQSFNAQLSLLRSGLSDVAISIGEALAGPLGKLVTWFQDQIPAIKAFVEEAIPQVEEFVNRSIAKFREFKTFFNENLRDPLNDFKETLLEFKTIGIGELEALVERFRTFAPDFKAALDEGDAEEAGRLLGEFIANTFRSAFEAAGDITAPLTQWAKSQDWGQIGMTVGSFAVEFLVGFFKGMFSDPEAAQNEADRASATITETFSDSLLNGILAALIVSRIPIIGAPVRVLLRPFGAGFKALGRVLREKVLPALGRAVWAGISGAFAAVGRGIATLGGMLWNGLSTAFTNLISGIGTAIRPFFQQFQIAIRGAFRRWAFSFGGVAGATIRQAIGVLLRVALRALAGVVGGIVVAIFGWPAIILAAAVLAFREFIIRFTKWNEEQGDKYEGFGAKIVAFIGQGLVKMKDWFMKTVGKWFADRWQETKDLVGKIDWSAIGGDVIMGVVRGIKNKNLEIGNALIDAARDAWKRVKDFFQSKSPSMLFAGLGGDLMLGMAQGIDRSAKVVTDAMGEVSMDTAGVRFDAPELPGLSRADARGQTVINVTVTSADPQAVVEALRRYTRANGPLGSVVNLGQAVSV